METNKKITNIQKIKPVLLLDLDGVINPFGVPNPIKIEYVIDTTMEIHGKHWGVSIPKIYVEWLRELNELYDIHWCTAWQNNANTMLAPILNLPKLPVVPLYREHFKEGTTWKMINIQDYVYEHIIDRPLVWIDDDIFTFTWAKKRNKNHPTLFIKTNKFCGLNKSQMNKLREFAQRNTN